MSEAVPLSPNAQNPAGQPPELQDASQLSYSGEGLPANAPLLSELPPVEGTGIDSAYVDTRWSGLRNLWRKVKSAAHAAGTALRITVPARGSMSEVALGLGESLAARAYAGVTAEMIRGPLQHGDGYDTVRGNPLLRRGYQRRVEQRLDEQMPYMRGLVDSQGRPTREEEPYTLFGLIVGATLGATAVRGRIGQVPLSRGRYSHTSSGRF